jgi:hypothetical protein
VRAADRRTRPLLLKRRTMTDRIQGRPTDPDAVALLDPRGEVA